MLTLRTNRIGDVAVVECSGRIVQSDSAFALRNTVIVLEDAQYILLNFSGISAIEGGGLGMLMFLQQWAYDHNIHLEVVHATKSVSDRIEMASAQNAKSMEEMAMRSDRKRNTRPLRCAHCAITWC
jgi:hypothetical protein